ncbi:SigE family RNA polymerase sigma factor [Micromonospora sp. PLK6-60]|uniref:SigE family RNA polymerase sigma factor n=1 Tax=Micromonospora sp. PLK6-60 TaxID=2873383 RepID=UPI001CA706C8|nr:SigE family RNA polymerase sigma factor [Micromonospora sp. PLK6-60]MBY8871597.1 SigE family RNA polymerase sigma factor [Micromonospora sp. PLK6-60]
MAARDPLEEEFREFVAARSPALLRTAYLLAGDWATAEDLLQTALTKTYLAWKRLGGIEAIEPYARRVLVNTSTSWWRRRWHGERPTDVLPERAGIDEIEQQLDRDVLWRHLTALPARQRAVLVLRFYEDMSEAQTAALLEISTGTVKSQTSRALATLRRRLGESAAAELAERESAAPAGTARRTPERSAPPTVGPDPRSPERSAPPAARPDPRSPERSASQAVRPASTAPAPVPASTVPPRPAGPIRRAAPAGPARSAALAGGTATPSTVGAARELP